MDYPIGKFDRVIVREDYVNLHGQLIARKGAKGVIRSRDRDRYGVDFALDDELVAIDACGRRCHAIPVHYLETIYDETNSIYK